MQINKDEAPKKTVALKNSFQLNPKQLEVNKSVSQKNTESIKAPEVNSGSKKMIQELQFEEELEKLKMTPKISNSSIEGLSTLPSVYQFQSEAVQYLNQIQLESSGNIPAKGQFQHGPSPNVHFQPGELQLNNVPILPVDLSGINPMNIESEQIQAINQPPLLPSQTLVGVDSLLLGYHPTTNTATQLQQQRVDNKNPHHHLQYQGTIANFIRDRREEDKAYGFINSQSITEKGVPRNKSNSVQTTETGADREQKSKDIFFSAHSVQSNLLDLQRGDEVEFRIFISNKAARNNSKPKAANVTVIKLSKRDNDTLSDYLDKVKAILEPESTSMATQHNRRMQRMGRFERGGYRGGFRGGLDSGDEENDKEEGKLIYITRSKNIILH